MAATSTANQAILTRLQSMTSFHPATADLFADWTLDPGDVVTVTKGEESFAVPIYRMNMEWKGDSTGKTRIQIESSGAQKRPPYSELKRGSYSGGRRQEITDQELVRHQTGIDRSDMRLNLWATEEQWDAMAQQYVLSGKSEFSIQSDQIQSTVLETGATQGVLTFDPNHAYVYGEKCLYNGALYRCTNENGHSGAWGTGADFSTVASMQSQITQNASNITLEVQNRVAGDNTLSGRINVQAGRVDLVVTGEGENATINTGNIFLAMNGDGTTAGGINANKVILGSGNLSDKVTVLGMLEVSGGNLVCKGEGAGGRGTLEADTIEAHYIDMDIGSTIDTTYLNANEIGNVDHLYLSDGETDLVNCYNGVTKTESNGQITLTFDKAGGGQDQVTFSRAISSFTGAWDGNALTVTASPQNQSYTETMTVALSPNTNVGTTINHFTSSHTAAINIGASSIPSGYWKQFVIDATEVYDAVTVAKPTAQSISGGTTKAASLITATASNGNVSTGANLKIEADPVYSGHVRATLDGLVIARIAGSGAGSYTGLEKGNWNSSNNSITISASTTSTTASVTLTLSQGTSQITRNNSGGFSVGRPLLDGGVATGLVFSTGAASVIYEADGYVVPDSAQGYTASNNYELTPYIHFSGGYSLTAGNAHGYVAKISLAKAKVYDPAWNDGWDAAQGKVAWPSAYTGSTFGVQVPNTTRNQPYIQSFSLQKSGGYVNCVMNGTTVARVSVSTSGTISAGGATSSVPSGAGSSPINSYTFGTGGHTAYIKLTATGEATKYIEISY